MRKRTRKLLAAMPQILEAVQRVASVLSSPPWFRQLAPKPKADGTKVTPLDPKIERELIQEIRQILSPDSWHVIGEEGTSGRKPKAIAPYTIICDPIDGTALAANGLLSLVGVNLAFLGENTEPLLGIIHLPLRASVSKGEMGVTYVASRLSGEWEFSCSGESAAIQKLNPKQPFYLHVSSYAHRSLDLANFEGKLRAWGATGQRLVYFHLPLALARTQASAFPLQSEGCTPADISCRRRDKSEHREEWLVATSVAGCWI